MGNAYIVRSDDDECPSDCDIAFTLDVLVNGNVTLSDPHRLGVDVFEFAGQRLRPVRWDLNSHTLLCWRVP